MQKNSSSSNTCLSDGAAPITNPLADSARICRRSSEASVMCQPVLERALPDADRGSHAPTKSCPKDWKTPASPSHCCGVPCAMTRQHFNPRSKIEPLRDDLEMVVELLLLLSDSVHVRGRLADVSSVLGVIVTTVVVRGSPRLPALPCSRYNPRDSTTSLDAVWCSRRRCRVAVLPGCNQKPVHVRRNWHIPRLNLCGLLGIFKKR